MFEKLSICHHLKWCTKPALLCKTNDIVKSMSSDLITSYLCMNIISRSILKYAVYNFCTIELPKFNLKSVSNFFRKYFCVWSEAHGELQLSDT